jgi:hypothetical protein
MRVLGPKWDATPQKNIYSEVKKPHGVLIGTQKSM